MAMYNVYYLSIEFIKDKKRDHNGNSRQAKQCQ